MVSLPSRGGKVDIPAEVVEQGFRMIYELPALAGYGEFWALSNHEAKALSEPASRMLARMSPRAHEMASRYLDPIALVSAAVVITLPRLEMTRAYKQQMQIHRETEARRAAIARATGGGNEETPRGVSNGGGRENPDAGASADGAGGVPGSGQHVKNLFDTG